MNKRIILGSILAVSLLMLVPSISAIETNQVVESNKSRLLDRLQEMDISSLIQNIKENTEGKRGITGTIGFIIDLILIIIEGFFWSSCLHYR